MKKLRIGPSGNSLAFYEAGHKHTTEAAEWLSEIGLTAFEYSFGRGVNISEETATAIGNEMKKYDIALSVHAPYYINFASSEQENIQKSYDYIKRSAEKAVLMGGNRIIFHPAVQGKMERREAVELTKKNIEGMVEYVLSGVSEKDIIICPETMGKFSQIGTVEEIVEICSLHEVLVPCFDFGHINCLMKGELKTYDDYKRIIDYSISKLGKEKVFNMHIHFSKIQFGASGEIRHLTLASQDFGPDYQPLARLIDDYKMNPTIICESKEIMSDDAKLMKSMHK